MSGSPLAQAVDGGETFVREAFSAGYDCGLVLWAGYVVTYLPAQTSPEPIVEAPHQARTWGGTNLVPTPDLALEKLALLAGERVLCVFSDSAV